MSGVIHIPVMLSEIVEWIDPKPGQTIVDGTLGGGGHTRALAERVGRAGTVVAFDRDPAALTAAEENLAGLPVKLVHGSYSELPEVLKQIGVEQIDGIVLDLGLSSDQLADRERGFSFESEGPLDLRFDPSEGEPTWQWLARLAEKELADLIYQFGEERLSRRIARRIVETNKATPIRTARELADIVRRVVPRSRDSERIHPATRTFQALRIAVNHELSELDRVLTKLPQCLAPSGRAAIISFHSLEDRRVKEAFRGDPHWNVLTKKPIRPTDNETTRNPRARSAKLRVAARAM